jgi:hypothetical protein
MLEKQSLLFKKPLMKGSLFSLIFACGFLGASQLPGRLMTQRDVNNERYAGTIDIVSRFRLGQREEE